MTTNVITWLCLLSLAVLLVAAQNSASQAYTPIAGTCPDDFTLVRLAGSPGTQSLSTSEAAYVQARRLQVIPQAWKTYLANVEAKKVALPSYVSSILNGTSSETPNFGIATSGGGYRAAIFGAGVLNALDGRNASSRSVGLGGLLQAATYMSGLSGGSWLLTSLTQANFPTIQQLVFGYRNPTVANNAWGGWNANYSIYAPSSNPVTNVKYLNNLVVSCTDVKSFTSYTIPFPIVVTDLSALNQNTSDIIPGGYIPLSNPIFEFNVFEMGSFDPMLSAFTPTKYLGTTNKTICITNFDQLALVSGTSSALFNTQNISSTYGAEISLISKFLPEKGIELDVASWPNPFYGVAPETFISSNQTKLMLVDGFENGENVPIQPLLVKARNVDTILAIDASGNVKNFANGSALIATYLRATQLSSAYSFPSVPTSAGEFVAQNLTTRPTFFGCNATGTNVTEPLVIYLANGGPPLNGNAPVTNIPTLQVSSSISKTQAMLDQTFVIATQGRPANSSMTSDPEWPACLACAIVDRARERAGEVRSGICDSCFARYCWSGSTLGINQNSGRKEIVDGHHTRWFMTLTLVAVVWALV